MAEQQAGRLIALIVPRPDMVHGGGLPVFIQEDEAKRKRLAVGLSRLVRAAVHELEDGMYVIAQH